MTSLAQFYDLPEAEQDYWLRKDAEKRRTCRHGHDLALCTDPGTAWYPQRLVDYAEMEQRAAEARYAALHEDAPYHDGTFEYWSADRTAAFPYRYDEGVDIVVTTVDHEGGEDFLKRVIPGVD